MAAQLVLYQGRDNNPDSVSLEAAWAFKGLLNRAIQFKTSRLGSGGVCTSGRIPEALVIALLEHASGHSA